MILRERGSTRENHRCFACGSLFVHIENTEEKHEIKNNPAGIFPRRARKHLPISIRLQRRHDCDWQWAGLVILRIGVAQFGHPYLRGSLHL